MTTDATRYPLSWPFGWKRTPAKDRKESTFGQVAMVKRAGYENGMRVEKEVKGSKPVTMPVARNRLTQQLQLLGADYHSVIMSTNVELTSYGEPRAGRRPPDDPGVAVYFQLHGKDRVLACDRWLTVHENIAAIAAHIDAIRRVDRYGVGTLDQAFAGYDALPPPGAANRPPWRKVLGIVEGVEVTEGVIQHFYRARARELHPDLGGTHEGMAQLNEARDAALQELEN
jgi:hypothetical protein